MSSPSRSRSGRRPPSSSQPEQPQHQRQPTRREAGRGVDEFPPTAPPGHQAALAAPVPGGRRSTLPSLADLAGLEPRASRPPSPSPTTSLNSSRIFTPQQFSPGDAASSLSYGAAAHPPLPPPATGRPDATGEEYRIPGYAAQQPSLSPLSRPAQDAERWEESLARRRAQSLTFAGQGHSPQFPAPYPVTRHLSIETTTSSSQPWGAGPAYMAAPGVSYVQADGPTHHHGQPMHSVMVDMGGSGPPYAMPLDVSRASRDASEKRARNASASARFRARKRERDDAAGLELSGLRQRLEETQEDADFYRADRDEVLRLLLDTPGGRRHLPRPESPRLRRLRAGSPRRRSTSMASSAAAPPQYGFAADSYAPYAEQGASGGAPGGRAPPSAGRAPGERRPDLR